MTTKRQRILAEAELRQAGTRHARSEHAGDAESSAASARLGAAYGRAMRAGMTFDRAYEITQETTARVEREAQRPRR